MKKKILTAAILAALAFSLAACGAGQSTPAPDSSSTSTGPQVDLQTFHDATVAKHDFGPMHKADDDLVDTLYDGLNDISVTQQLVYTPEARQNSGDFCLVQVQDPEDVAVVEGIFQNRVDIMAGGGAWYDDLIEQWNSNSRIVSNGTCIILVVNEDCDGIVEDFNALF